MQGKETSQAQSTTALLGLVPVMEGQLSPNTKICEYRQPLAQPLTSTSGDWQRVDALSANS